MREEGEGSGHRAAFAERFALLYAEAGDPPLKQVAASVDRARRTDRGSAVRVSAQRLSDWRRGRNVPARFAVLSAVLEILIGRARRIRPQPRMPELYDVGAWRTLWEAALASPSADDPAAQRPNDGGMCPFPGLAAFEEGDAAWFFGRDRATRALISRFRGACRAGGMVTLVGASGSGKTSLLRAGFVPSLTKWPVVLMVPGSDPAGELATRVPALAEAMRAATGEVDERAVRRAFAAHVKRVAEPGARLVLVVDQVEEIFTLCPDEARRRAFIQALHAGSTAEGAEIPAPVVVILGIRADFYGRCLEYPQLTRALQGWQLALGPMTAQELREVVTGPPRAVGLRTETGLVELLLRELQGAHDGGTLPLLSHALLATWQRRQGDRLTISGYRATGGIQRAIASSAERAWSRLRPERRETARRLLMGLVQAGRGTQDTRRRATRTELIEQAGGGAAAEETLEVLAGHRLITLDSDWVEITHEALLLAWPRLRRWIDNDRERILVRQRLEEDADVWLTTGRDRSALYRGARLAAAEQLFTPDDRPDDQTETSRAAREFVAASGRHERNLKRARRAAVAMVAALALVAAAAATVAVRQRDEARLTQVLAQADRVLDIDQSLSAQLNLVAHRMRPDDEVYTRLISTQATPLATPLAGHTGAVYLTSFHPDGRVLATAGYDHTVRLWNVSDGHRPEALGEPLYGHTGRVTSAVFSPDGRTLATAGDDQTIRLWDVGDPSRPRPAGTPFTGRNGTVHLVAFSPDGRTLATANEDQTVRLWDVGDPGEPEPLDEPITGHTGAVRSVAFSPDGRLLATGSDDHTVRLWDVSERDEPEPLGKPLTGHTDLVHSVAFAPGGDFLASGGKDGTICLWNVRDPDRATSVRKPLTGHDGQVWSVAFSPDGRRLATAGADSTTRLWTVADPAAAAPIGRPLRARTGIVFAVAFSPDGRRLATGSADGIVRIWSMPPAMITGHSDGVVQAAYRPDGRALVTGSGDRTARLWRLAGRVDPRPLGPPLSGHDGALHRLAFDPDGDVLATTGADMTVRLWNVSDPARASPFRRPMTVDNRSPGPVAFGPRGRLLATAHDDTAVRLWDVRDPDHPVPVGRPLSGHDGPVYSAAFHPAGRLLATASGDQTVRLWNITNPAGAEPAGRALAGHLGPVNQAAFSPDGRILATAGDDNTVRLWDVGDPRRPGPLGRPVIGHTEAVTSVAFSPDGSILATGGYDNTVRLWDVTDPLDIAPIGRSLTGHTAAVLSVMFSPGGHALVTASNDRTARVWDLNRTRAIRRICATTRDVLTRRQWEQFIPQLPYEPPCG